MTLFLLVCLGGAVGTGARYLLALLAARGGATFPYATLLVNLLGSFLIAAVFAASESVDWLSPNVRTIVSVGLLGGFTTYSAFSLETLRLLQAGAVTEAIVNVAATLIGCLLACWAGWVCGRILAAG